MEEKKLVFTIISGNEEKWVKGFCESIMKANPYKVCVNLTQFEDKTEELFRQYIPADKLLLIKNKWENSFSAARNKCLEIIPSDADYLMYVDLDEVITEESYKGIKELLNHQEIIVPLVTIYNTLDTPGLSASLFYPRIFPWKSLTKKPFFEGSVHNQLIIDPSIPTVRVPIAVLHYGYALDKETMKKKHERSEKLLRGQIEHDNDDFFAHLNLAQLLRAKGDLLGTEEHALEVLRIVGDKKGGNFDHAAIMAMEQLSTSYIGQKRPEEALEMAQKALTLKPDHLDSIINMANAYMELNNLDSAEQWYKRYLFIRSKYNEMRDNTNLILNHLNSSFICWYNLGIIKLMQKKYKEASEHFYKCYKEEPEFKDAYIRYLHSLQLSGISVDKLAEYFNKYLEQYPDKASQVYLFYGELALHECNIELAKFNFYQALTLAKNEDETKMLKNRWINLSEIFGQVSNSFFDTSKKIDQMKTKMEI